MNPHNLSRVRPALLAAIALLSVAAPAEAQLVPCAGIQGTGYKILLDDIFDAAGGTASPLMSSLVFKLTTNLEQLQLESGLPLKVIRCAKRRPSDPADFKRPMVAELWFYPDGSRILELSTKCKPSEAFQVAAETRAFLATKDISTTGEQQTKTKTALDFFAKRGD